MQQKEKLEFNLESYQGLQRAYRIRTETTTSTARIFGYYGILFHRGNQLCTAKEDLSYYISLDHARKANNKCYTIRKSLVKRCNKLLSQARSASIQASDNLSTKTIHLQELLAVPETNINSRKKVRTTRHTSNNTYLAEQAGRSSISLPLPESYWYHHVCRSCIHRYLNRSRLISMKSFGSDWI